MRQAWSSFSLSSVKMSYGEWEISAGYRISLIQARLFSSFSVSHYSLFKFCQRKFSFSWSGEGERLKNSTYQLFWAQNPLRHPELFISQQDFPSKDPIIFELPASKHLPEEQIFWGTDPLGAPSSTLDHELSRLLKTTSRKSCILDPIPGISMEDCYTISLPVIVSNTCICVLQRSSFRSVT